MCKINQDNESIVIIEDVHAKLLGGRTRPKITVSVCGYIDRETIPPTVILPLGHLLNFPAMTRQLAGSSMPSRQMAMPPS